MPTFCINFSYVGIRWLKRCSLTGPLALQDTGTLHATWRFSDQIVALYKPKSSLSMVSNKYTPGKRSIKGV